MKHSNALWAILVVALWSMPASAQSVEDDTFSSPMEAIVSDIVGWHIGAAPIGDLLDEWPLLRDLEGLARMRARVARDGQGALYRDVLLESESVKLGDLDLGKLRITIRSPLVGGRSRVTIDLVGPAAKRFHADLRLPAKVGLATAKLDWRKGKLEGKIEIEGFDLTGMTKAFPVFALGGSVNVSVSVGGTTDSPTFGAVIGAREVSWRGDEVGTLDVVWNHAKRSSEVDLRWGEPKAPHAVASLKVPVAVDVRALDLRWLDAKPHSVKIEAGALTPKLLRPFWRAPPAANFKVSFVAEGRGTLDRFRLNAAIEGQLMDRDQAPLPILARLYVTPKEQTLWFELRKDIFHAEVVARAPLVKLRRTPMTWASAPVEGRLDMNVPFPTLGPYLPRIFYNPQGSLEGHVEVEGTLGEPDFKGKLASQRAAVTLVDLNQRLRGVNLTGTIEGDTLTVSSLEARSGLGRVNGEGTVTLTATPKGYDPAGGLWGGWSLSAGMGVDMTRLPIIHDTFPNGLVEGHIDLALAMKAHDTELSITVRKAQGRLMDVHMPSAKAIPTNRSVRLIDWAGRANDTDSVFAGDGHLRVIFDIADPITLEGAETKLVLSGRLIVDRRDHMAAVEGGFEVAQGGRFQLFENPFTIKSGRLTLLGGDLNDRGSILQGASGEEALFDPDKPPEAVPLEPVVSFLARGVATDTHVLVKVGGPARRPVLELVSTPALPEYQIMTLLITGRVDAVDDSNGDVRRQVARLVSRFHNPSLSRQLYDRLGVDKLGLGFGKSVAQPILTVGKQLNRQLYVETVYHHDAPPEENEKEGHAEYRLNPRWTFDTIYGDAAVGKVGIFWHNRFGGAPPPDPPEDWGE